MSEKGRKLIKIPLFADLKSKRMLWRVENPTNVRKEVGSNRKPFKSLKTCQNPSNVLKEEEACQISLIDNPKLNRILDKPTNVLKKIEVLIETIQMSEKGEKIPLFDNPKSKRALPYHLRFVLSKSKFHIHLWFVILKNLILMVLKMFGKRENRKKIVI